MKKQYIIWFILGMGLLAAMSSCTSVTAQSTPNSIVVRPALPKVVRIKYIRGSEGADSVDQYIRQCIQDGYIIKSVAGSGGSWDSWVVVAEKY